MLQFHFTAVFHFLARMVVYASNENLPVNAPILISQCTVYVGDSPEIYLFSTWRSDLLL